MNTHKQELERFCNDQGCRKETFQKALEYLQSVHAKRAGQRMTGNALVPSCAYLASQRLQNNEISKDAARKKSCLTAAVFDKEYENIRKLLPVDSASSRQGRKARGYEQLIQRYRPSASRADLHYWLSEVEKRQATSSKNFDWESVTAKCATFFWVYDAIEDKSSNKHHFADENQIDRGNFTKICSYLDHLCKDLKDEILENIYSPPSESIPSPVLVTTAPRNSPRQSPLKRPLRAVLSRDSPKKPKIAEPEPESVEIPAVSNPPAPVGDVEMLPPPKTPSKRIRLFGETGTSSSAHRILDMQARTTGITPQSQKTLESPSIPQPRTPAEPFTPSRRKSARIEAALSESPSKASKTLRKTHSEDLMDVDSAVDAPSSEDEKAEFDPPTSRRFRPVFHDRKQWSCGDPQLRIDWEGARTTSQRRVELYGHLFRESRS
ncbi:hypothetical protein L218DRAFT_954130 [Marasmius fiardii PR-910]|nr:hypothetical protein L218DRAFT_954130 [Marasmius fiardii PR-910]